MLLVPPRLKTPQAPVKDPPTGDLWPMIQLIYSSAATAPFKPEALRLLLARARARNLEHHVTGMLVYHNESFLQVLEGPDSSVDLIFQSIAQDPRHTSSRILSREPIFVREFRSWAMGFTDTTPQTAYPEGFVDYFRDLPRMANDRSRARKFLMHFQEGSYRERISA